VGWTAPLLLAACGARSRAISGPDASVPDARVPDAQAWWDTPPCPDQDGDGFLPPECGGADCDDADASVFPGAPVWIQRRIEDGDFPSIAIDPDGAAWVAFAGTSPGGPDDVLLATDMGDWLVQGVEPDTGGRPKLAIDAEGFPHVVYTVDEVQLRHAFVERTADGVDWVFETVEDDRGVGAINEELDLALGPGDEVHVAYSHASAGAPQDLFWATGAGDSWVLERVDPGPGWGLSIAIDGEGVPHVAYQDEEELVVAYRRGDSWTKQSVAPTWESNPTDIAFEPDGSMRIAFVQPITDAPSPLAVASNASGVWETERIHGTESFYEPSLAVDPDGVVHVAFSYRGWSQGEKDSRIEYATDAGGLWTIEEVADGRRPVIAVGPSGEIEIAYSKPAESPRGVWHAERTEACP